MALVAALGEMAGRVSSITADADPTSRGSGDVDTTGLSGGVSPATMGVPVPSESAAEAEAESNLSDKLFLSELAISPVRFQVSLTSRRSDGVLEDLLLQPGGGSNSSSGEEDGDGGGGGGGGAIATAVLRAMGTTMSEIENATLRLKPLVLSHIFTRPEDLVETLGAHYKGQAVRQVLFLLGSSKVLGNPLGTLSNMQAGVKDFFYEPIAGLSRSPFGFATGVFKGTSSLVRRTLYSFTDTADRIVSSVSSGILASGAVDVSVRGGTGVVRPYGALDGVMLGVACAVREPLMGLHLGGFSGMATGLFTGGVGLVLRPTYGALMSTSQLCQIVSGQLDPRLDSEQKLRMLRTRPPRFFRSREQVLSVFSREENIGEELLSRVHMGRYRSDGYVWHASIEGNMIVLVTGRRVLVLHGDGGGGTTNSAAPRRHTYGVVEWEVDFGLVVWLEIDGDREESSPAPVQRRARGGGGGGGSGSRASVSVFHFPDLSAERSGGGGGGRGGGKPTVVVAAIRLERRVLSCVDGEQALQVHRVLSRQVSARRRTAPSTVPVPEELEGVDGDGASI
ncbi:unnamed protein product [Scytosiphon promiscuus]